MLTKEEMEERIDRIKALSDIIRPAEAEKKLLIDELKPDFIAAHGIDKKVVTSGGSVAVAFTKGNGRRVDFDLLATLLSPEDYARVVTPAPDSLCLRVS